MSEGKPSDARAAFDAQRVVDTARQGGDASLRTASLRWMLDTSRYAYTYQFNWLGVPIIQFPQDILAMQEIIWSVRPDLIIETGIAHGGSLIFYASLLELIGGPGEVLGIDIDIRPHNRTAIDSHPMARRISLVEGSSVDERIVTQVHARAKGKQRVLVALDSNHTHDHVLGELRAYSGLVTRGSYLVVFDTTIDDCPPGFFPGRPWGPGNNPKTAVAAFLADTDRFEIDSAITDKLLITVARDGYLRCVKD